MRYVRTTKTKTDRKFKEIMRIRQRLKLMKENTVYWNLLKKETLYKKKLP